MNALFVKALKNKFDMDKEDALSVAKTVENVFKGREEVEDMDIDKHVRSLFYELHREKLLKLRREEFKEKGKQMRKYYWSFDTEMIKQGAKPHRKKEDPYTVYKNIPASVWLEHTACNT